MSSPMTCKTRKCIGIGVPSGCSHDRLANQRLGPFVGGVTPQFSFAISCHRLFAVKGDGSKPRIPFRQVATCSRHGALTGGTIAVPAASFRAFGLIQPPGTAIVASKKQIQTGFSDPNADSAKL